MLLHDSYFHSFNRSINASHERMVIVAYSPLFHSTFTLLISIFGLFFNLICSAKICSVLYQYRQRKPNNPEEDSQDPSTHILSHHKYRFLLVLTSNDALLCLSSIISCLDEKYFYQAFLARHQLCAAHILVWKFTLHFIPLLTIVVLCRYHYVLNKTFQAKSPNLSTLKQLLCTDLNILIAFVLAVAWSVDGLWLWGVANIKDYIKLPLSPNEEYTHLNGTIAVSASGSDFLNTTLSEPTFSASERPTEQKDDLDGVFLPQQTTICYFQTNHNFQFSVRLIHLIEADFLLLFSLHAIGLVLEVLLHMRLCCCIIIKRVTSAFSHERQLCLYILYIFILITLTSLPFYFYRIRGFLFDTQSNPGSNDLITGRIFAQILLVGACFKPLLSFILFFPPSMLFYLKCYLKCYSPTKNQLSEPNDELLSASNDPNQPGPRESTASAQHHRYSLFVHSSHDLKFHSKFRTETNPV